MTRRLRFVLASSLMMVATAANAATMTVLKSPSCGCCAKWVEHVRKAGFEVKVVNVDDMMAVKAKAGVPMKLASCHTTMVGGYIIEGHVPAADVRKLLAMKPRARGISVPGMPMGAPGMEHGDHREHYQVLLIKADGTTSVFARH